MSLWNGTCAPLPKTSAKRLAAHPSPSPKSLASRTMFYQRDLKADGGADRFRGRTGLPISPYFSATKLMWLLDNVAGLRELAEK